MSEDKKDEGGIVLGGISFGVTKTPEPQAAGDAKPSTVVDTTAAVAAPPGATVERDAAAGPLELEEELLPLRLAIVADLNARGEYNAGAHPPEQPTRVDPMHLSELFRALAPRLTIEVDSVLLEGGRTRIAFSPRDMKSFRPDNLCQDVPLLRSLLDGKRVLERLRDGTTNVEASASELAQLWNNSPFVATVLGGVQVRQGASAAVAAPAASTANDDVSALLDMVDMGGDSSPATPPASATSAAPNPAVAASSGGKKGRFDAFLHAIANAGGGTPGARPDEGIRSIEQAVALQLGAIVQHPEFRRLEEAWRGLAFLCGRTPKTGVRLEVISATVEDTPAALERIINAHASVEPPVSLAVVDVAIGADAASLALWRKLGEVGESYALPILCNATAKLLGRDQLDDIDRLDNKQALFDAAQSLPWRTQANRAESMWVALGLNRVLSRQAYDKRTSRVREAIVEEQPNDGATATVWMQPCWAVASLCLRSFDKWSWPCGITGARDGGTIEDLPVHEVAMHHDDGQKVAIPTEAFFSTETQRALGRLGVLALSVQPNNDEAYLLSAATSYVPPPKRTQSYDTAEEKVMPPKAPLTDQLFVARLAQFLQSLGSRISQDNAASQIEEVLQAAVLELFRNAPPSGPEIAVQVKNAAGGLRASVTVRPRRFLGVQMEEITLGVPLG